MDKSPIVIRINSLLAKKRITKAEFYEKCALTSASYSQWNTGKTKPRLQTIERIAEFLGVPSEYLLYGDAAQMPSQAEKKERPANGETLISDLPEEVQELIRICMKTPSLVPAFVNLARQIEKGSSARE